MHFGYWSRYSSRPFKTRNSKEAGMQLDDWLKSNDALLSRVEEIFQNLFPQLHQQALSTPTHLRPFKMWTTIAVNVTSQKGMTLHKDNKDWKNGFCAIIPFGKFGGGQLSFPELDLSITTKNTGIVFFRSNELIHGVTPFTGNRGSLVLFNCQNTLKRFL
jgi:hypothetical protein